MYAVLEIGNKISLDAVRKTVLLGSPMVKFSPTFPAGVSSAGIYYRPTHTITMMEFKGNGYVIVTSSSEPATNVVQNLKSLADTKGGFNRILNSVEAGKFASLAKSIY